jgi:hypothetical protein
VSQRRGKSGEVAVSNPFAQVIDMHAVAPTTANWCCFGIENATPLIEITSSLQREG